MKKYDFKTNSKRRVPQATSYPTESILMDPLKSTECDCNFFLGPYRRMKGLTVKVVVFINGHGRSSGYNRLAVYTALSRSSCTFRLLNVKVLDMNTEQYQIDRMNFAKEKMKDEGFERRANYTYYTKSTEYVEALHTIHGSIRDPPKVMYIRPDGTTDSDNIATLPTLNNLGNAISASTSSRYLGEVPEPSQQEKAKEKVHTLDML